MALPNGKNPQFDTLNYVASVISGQGATKVLTEADSGALCVFDRAAGIVFTLPSPKVGLVFDFVVRTTITSNAAKIITDSASTFLVGAYTNVDTDTSNAVAAFNGDGSTHVSVSMNGTTSGGVKGTKLRFTCTSATEWTVEGIVLGTGVVATAFATS